MLVLSRRCGEGVVVHLDHDVITLVIAKISGSRVRIGVEAPEQLAVHRQEVFDKLVVESSSPDTAPRETH